MASAIMIVQGPAGASPPGGMPQHGDSGGPLLCNGVITGVYSGTWSYPVMSGSDYTALDSSITFDSAWVTNIASNYVNEPLLSVASWSSNRLDLFARGTDGALYQKTWDSSLPPVNNSHWYPSLVGWQYLGGFLTGTPEAVSWGANRLDIFMRGGDGNPQTDAFSSMSLWHLYWNGSAWNWDGPLSSGLASHPSAVSWGPNRLDVFALNSAGLIAHWFGTNTITAVETAGGDGGPTKFLPQMKAFSTSPGTIDLYAVGVDNALYHSNYSTYWTDWDYLGGYVVGTPAVTSWGGGREDIFVKSGDNNIYQKTYMGGTWYPSMTGFSALGGPVGDGSPAATSMQQNWLTLMMNGPSDSTAYKGWFNGSQWAPTNTTWYNTSGINVGSPVLIANPGVDVDAFSFGNTFSPGIASYSPMGPPASYGWSGFGGLGGTFSW